MSNTSSIPAAITGNMGATMSWAFKKALQQTDDMLPVEVTAHDRDAGTVSIRHFITMVNVDGEQVERSQQADVQVVTAGGGGFMINFDLPVGSKGYIKALDRDIELFLLNYEQSPPDTARFHSFSSGVFIPDVMTGWTIDDEDRAEGTMVIQSLAGDIKISLNTDRIKIKHPKKVEILTKDLEVTGDSKFIGKVNINGNDFDSHWHGYIDSKGSAATPAVSETAAVDTEAVAP